MQPSHTLIILLLVANLVATIWFGLSSQTSSPVSTSTSTVNHELPNAIDSEVRSKILDDFILNFNQKDLDGLYNLFSPAAQAQFSRESSDDTFNKLITYFISAKGGAYTHSEYIGSQGDLKQYNLYYAVKLDEKSVFSESGKLKVTIVVRGTEYEIYGIHLNSESSS